MLNVISVVFIVMVIIYVLLRFKHLHYLDTMMVVASIIVLSLTLMFQHSNRRQLEFFEVAPASAPKELRDLRLEDLSPLSVQEDPKPMLKATSVYLTVFNDTSFPGGGKEIYNLAYKEKEGTCKQSNRTFYLDTIPTFDKPNGLVMNTNRLTGPFSNNLGIDIQSSFTLFFTCRHGMFQPNTSEVEFLKLYANSNDNNGLAFFIPAQSVVVGPETQTAQLRIKYADSAPIPCTVGTSQTITFDRTNMTSYFIVKQVDKLIVYTIVGDALTPTQLVSTSIEETTATFSNKEFVMNRFKNYRGGIYQFGIIPTAITTEEIQRIHTHCLNQYKRVTSAEFIKVSSDYNAMLEFLKSFTNCPFNSETCKSCSTITNWTDTNQLVSSSADCRKAINTFCTNNPMHFRCKCWNTSSSDYNTTSCKMYRGIFDPDRTVYDNLSQDDLNYIRQKYTLIRPEDCPKPVVPDVKSCVNENLIKNNYLEYDFNRIKIDPKSLDKLGPSTKPGPVHSPYSNDPAAKLSLQELRKLGVEPKVTSTEDKTTSAKPSLRQMRDTSEETNYAYKEISLENPPKDMKNADTDHGYRVPGMSSENKVTNIYQTDANVNFTPTENTAYKEIEQTAQLSEEGSPFMNGLINMFFPKL